MKARLVIRTQALCLVFVATQLHGQTNRSAYNPAADFSSISNPNGVWSYGYAATLGGTFNHYFDHFNRDGLNVWRLNLQLDVPLCLHNPTPYTIPLGPFNTPTIGGGVIALHPGPNNEYSVVRFTAPTNGVYHVTGSFFGQDIIGTSTDVHILKNGESIFDGTVSGFGPGSGPSFYTIPTLLEGDYLDFAVGYGPNANFLYDMTGLSAWVSEVCWPIIFTQQPQSVTGPPGGSVTLSATVDGTPPFDYQWLYLGTTPVGGNSPTLTITDLGFDKLGSYYVTVLNCWGLRVWSFPAFVSMSVTNVPPNITVEPTNTTVSEGQTARFNVGVVGEEPLGLWWTHNGSVIPGERQASLVLSNVTLSASGTYQLFATNAWGATNSRLAALTVQQHALPTVAVTSPSSNSTVVIPANLPIQVTGSASKSALLGVQLFVDSQSIAVLSQPPYQFIYKAVNAGPHTITAVATDTNGVQATATLPVRFIQPPVNLSFEANGSVTLSLTVPADVHSLTVEASEDLQQWRTVTNVITSGSSLSLNDRAAPVRTGFYRLRYVLP